MIYKRRRIRRLDGDFPAAYGFENGNDNIELNFYCSIVGKSRKRLCDINAKKKLVYTFVIVYRIVMWK